MNDKILEISKVTKVYKSNSIIRKITSKNSNGIVLENVNFSLERGKIYGLIGRNGSGKSTLIKIIAGISNATEGRIRIFGEDDEENLRQARKAIGFLIEEPALHFGMTAKENMQLFQKIKGISDNSSIDEILKMVKLHDCNKKKVRNFSLGMKQRLGVALALVGNPEILILDEPMNSIDPYGVVEIRNILKKICSERNITMLVTEHDLNNLYLLATDYIIIDKGHIKDEITLEQLKEKCKKYILLRTDEPERMACILEDVLKTTNYRVMPDKSIRLYDDIDEVELLARTFLEKKLLVTNLSYECGTLEDYFLSVVRRA
ncbi:ABC transporter ATP-binding protein [Clostridium beijerinckii]|uniref:ABC transporter ATP-binding protein n=1 Tax=Clostridium beijerinckii TaxID=1520 RepID=UPI000478E109|nr:ABC transporter ATP-binding protein [Clostridium beijerinckii]